MRGQFDEWFVEQFDPAGMVVADAPTLLELPAGLVGPAVAGALVTRWCSLAGPTGTRKTSVALPGSNGS